MSDIILSDRYPWRDPEESPFVSDRHESNFANCTAGNEPEPNPVIANAIENDLERWDREGCAIVQEIEQRGGLDDNFSPGQYANDFAFACNALRQKMFAHYAATLGLDSECEEFDFQAEAVRIIEVNT